jgi:hypothetical protein
MHNLATSFVLGYHGCDQSVGEHLLRNGKFEPSTNQYDWLDSGVYFWQANPDRALLWAQEQRHRGKIKIPFVVGAVIELGFCMDLLTSNGISVVQAGYSRLHSEFEKSGLPLPENQEPGGRKESDRVLRYLDCAVVNYVHQVRQSTRMPPFDSVRGLFSEGQAAFKGSMFMEKTHVQICVRNQDNIHGVFRVQERYFSN